MDLDDTGVITFTNHAESLTQLDVQKLFDRFYTVKNSAVSTGLGLSIAKSLTELMGGTLDISIDGDLFKATITLPEA